AGGLVPASDPAWEDRPAPRRAAGSPAGDGRQGRPRARRHGQARGDPRGQGGASDGGMSHIYCPECGFQNPEAANYCSRCGALLVKDEPGSETTMSYTPEEGGEAREASVSLEDLGAEGPALVVRSGGGRAGEHFVPQGDRTTIGRSPDCDIFLDDVTVSRKHAVLLQRDGGYYIEDLGSLNGTFLNRKRIESGQLENGDELQIGKYKLTFLEK